MHAVDLSSTSSCGTYFTIGDAMTTLLQVQRKGTH
jgi:hypothetical protein